MKVLSLWQPWATFVALGVKTIETRSWKPPASAIGQPIAIHAGKRLPPELHHSGESWSEPVGEWYLRQTVSRRGARVNWRRQELVQPGTARIEPAPLGAIVATATLADVVPITSEVTGQRRANLEARTNGSPLVVVRRPEGGAEYYDEAAYGDYSEPGRFAWLLEDVKPTTERCPRCWREVHAVQPEARWVTDGPVHRLVHDGPCVFVDGACSCGTLDVGLACPTCHGSGGCDPVPYKGHQGLRDFDSERLLAR